MTNQSKYFCKIANYVFMSTVFDRVYLKEHIKLRGSRFSSYWRKRDSDTFHPKKMMGTDYKLAFSGMENLIKKLDARKLKIQN